MGELSFIRCLLCAASPLLEGLPGSFSDSSSLLCIIYFIEKEINSQILGGLPEVNLNKGQSQDHTQG